MTRRPAPLADKRVRAARNKRFRKLGIPYKACGSCFAVKPHKAFYEDSSKPDGRLTRCRVCHRKAATTRDQIRRQDPAVKQAKREYTRTHRATIKTRPLDIGDGHLPKQCTTVESGGCAELKTRGDFPRYRSRADQRDQWCRECMSRRNAQRRMIKRLRLLDYWDSIGCYSCHLCQGDFGPDDEIHIEHVMPRALGGTDDRENLLPAHAACNLAKLDADPYAYLPLVLAEAGISFAKAVGN